MRVVIVDETAVLGEAARRILSSIGATTAFAGSLQELSLAFETHKVPDLLVVNVTNGLTGWEVAARIERAGYRGRVLAFVDALDDAKIQYLTQLQHVDCVARPSSTALLDQVLKQALRGTRNVAERSLETIRPAYHGIIGESSQMADIFARIAKVAVGDVNVCIHGESGTGKELIARAIHYASPRRDRPLITLDCTTIPEGLMESHLFGHVKGAFTGATEHREGVFALAHTGDPVHRRARRAEPGAPGQAAARHPESRVLQGRRDEIDPNDIRLITATNKDLSGRGAGNVPRGPVLPSRGVHDQGPPAPRAHRGHPAPGRSLPAAFRGPLRPSASRVSRRRRSNA